MQIVSASMRSLRALLSLFIYSGIIVASFASLVTDITSNWRSKLQFCFYQHLKKSVDFFNIVVNLSKQIFQNNMEFSAQKISVPTKALPKAIFLAKFTKSKFLVKFSTKTKFLVKFSCDKRDPTFHYDIALFLEWPVSSRRHLQTWKCPTDLSALKPRPLARPIS